MNDIYDTSIYIHCPFVIQSLLAFPLPTSHKQRINTGYSDRLISLSPLSALAISNPFLRPHLCSS